MSSFQSVAHQKEVQSPAIEDCVRLHVFILTRRTEARDQLCGRLGALDMFFAT